MDSRGPLPVLGLFRSPVTGQSLSYTDNHTLSDSSGNAFPIIHGIPRFVGKQNYAASFGLQWNRFAKTQIDKFNGTHISRERLYQSAPWREEDLKGQRVLEVGSGAGRFTQILLDAGCEVYSVDYSDAVEVNRQNNSSHPRLHLCQASVYALPFVPEAFDKIVCLGMLQHTPDVEKAFFSMLPFLRPGGEIVVDVYPKTFKTYALNTKYWYRPVTKRMNKDLLLKLIRAVAPFWLPISSFLLRIPKAGFFLAQILPVVNYSGRFPQLTREQLLEWSILDTFDMLSPEYDQPQTLATLRHWFEKAGLDILYCGPGGNGFLGTGRKKQSDRRRG